MSTILSLILSISMLLSSALGPAAADLEPEAADTRPSGADTQSSARDIIDTVRDSPDRRPSLVDRAPSEGVDFADMSYVHYDPEPFYADAELLVSLAESGSADAVDALYDRLYDEFLYIDALSVLAMIDHDRDFYDEYWTQEYTYINTAWAEAQDALFEACSRVLETPCADSFTAHVGEDTAFLFSAYEPLTQEALDRTDRALTLENEYYALNDGLYDIPVTYRGETWTLNDFYGFRGNALAWSDYDAYMEIYDSLNRALNETLSPLYIEMVELWTETARDEGYDSYIDYAYDTVYYRDYTAEEAQALCDAVKPIAQAYFGDLYYSDISYDYARTEPSFTPEELIGILGEYLPRIDERLTEPFAAMTEHGLWDIGDFSSGRYDGSYTTTMLYYHSPFLFATLDGTCYDLTTITHEFGHFSDFWFSPQTNIIVQSDDYDLSEIHSNALQALFTEFYGDIYDDGADIAEYVNLSSLLEDIIDGCMQDEFQRRVFDEAEDLTPERINDIYSDICREYGLYTDLTWNSDWAYIPHTFTSPLYYISYAASAIAALQIWDMAQTDFDAAAETYMAVLSHGAHNEGYFQVLREAGLPLFTEEGVVSEVCRPVLDRLEHLSQQYG